MRSIILLIVIIFTSSVYAQQTAQPTPAPERPFVSDADFEQLSYENSFTSCEASPGGSADVRRELYADVYGTRTGDAGAAGTRGGNQ